MKEKEFTLCDFNNKCSHKKNGTCQTRWANDCKYHNLKERLWGAFVPCDAINEWVKHHSEICQTHATAGEQFTFSFLPSGIVEVQTVKCLICGKSHTEYVD